MSFLLPEMPLLTRLYSPYTLGFRRLVADYLERYWAARLRSARSQFRGPDLVEGAFATARVVPEHQRPQAIFRAILLGIRHRPLPVEIREWLGLNE